MPPDSNLAAGSGSAVAPAQDKVPGCVYGLTGRRSRLPPSEEGSKKAAAEKNAPQGIRQGRETPVSRAATTLHQDTTAPEVSR
ncbi:hypothetical protein GCM10009564_49100 [Streptomyces thermogriseus]|jgi:hypothetical protein|uniref:Uncharacterized protein n=1 Tax=Streptomyces thermogriseus TaxID=75292 RepID=A0ABN1T5L3_9ACTN